MVLSPFHLLKARITVEANVSVSFITVIIQLSHTASTLPSHHDDVTGRKLQNSRAGINPSGALLISTFSAWGLQTGLMMASMVDLPGLCVSLGSIIRSPSSASSKGFVLRLLGLPGSYPVLDGLHVIFLVTLSGGSRDCRLGTRCPRSGRTGPAI